MQSKIMLRVIILTLSVISLVRCIPPISTFQGFGTDMPIKIFNQVIAIDELSLRTSIKSHTAIKIKTDLSLTLQTMLWIQNLTDIIIQGPATISKAGIYIKNSTNIILHNLRILNAPIYGVLVYQSANVVINQLTILDASRSSVDQGKAIDITQGSINVTVSRTLLGYRNFSAIDKYKGMLIANFLHQRVTNVSLHHNLFYQNYQRNPQISTPGLFDMKNNIIYGYTEYGSRIRQGAYGNFQYNFYIGGKKDPIVFVDSSITLAYSSKNSWKFNYTTWQQITDLGHSKYAVPAVDFTVNFSKLISEFWGWGCQPQTYLEKEPRNTVIKYSTQQQQQVVE